MSGLNEEKLLEQMKRCWHLYSLPESKINQQAYNQLVEIIKTYFYSGVLEPKEGQITLTVTSEEITELSARLRDTSRQTLYETKLKRWLESKGFEVKNEK